MILSTRLVIMHLISFSCTFHVCHSVSTFEVRVCDLCQKFSSMIQDIGVDEYSFQPCDVDKCLKSSKFLLTTQELKMAFSDVDVNEGNLTIRGARSDQMSEILVYSILGRNIVEASEDNAAVYFFEYDVAKKVLRLKQPLCSFEKQIYSILLILTVVIILAALSMSIIEFKKSNLETYQKLNDVEQVMIPLPLASNGAPKSSDLMRRNLSLGPHSSVVQRGR